MGVVALGAQATLSEQRRLRCWRHFKKVENGHGLGQGLGEAMGLLHYTLSKNIYSRAQARCDSQDIAPHHPTDVSASTSSFPVFLPAPINACLDRRQYTPSWSHLWGGVGKASSTQAANGLRLSLTSRNKWKQVSYWADKEREGVRKRGL